MSNAAWHEHWILFCFRSSSGTGKTLVASALATECSNSERKVSFISRKGSDCLSKWVGESEKKLEKVFSLVGEVRSLIIPLNCACHFNIVKSNSREKSCASSQGRASPSSSIRRNNRFLLQAQQTKPCIIFFDEVDGLAPVRSSRQDFVHASVVSTLLALMDGLENNSEIIVIGATNRIDAIDPALRRPGRFDKELYFPLPCYSVFLYDRCISKAGSRNRRRSS